MPYPLHKSPRGLLGAFNLKTLGRAPTQFGDTVLPVSIVDDFYFGEITIVQKDIVMTNPAVSAADTWDVPAGKIWRLYGAALTGTLDAADIAKSVSGLFTINDGVNQIAVQSLTSAGQTGVAVKSAAVRMGPPWVLQPGWGVFGGFYISAAPAVSFTMTFSVAYQQFDL